jgi:hypothetical protein
MSFFQNNRVLFTAGHHQASENTYNTPLLDLLVEQIDIMNDVSAFRSTQPKLPNNPNKYSKPHFDLEDVNKKLNTATLSFPHGTDEAYSAQSTKSDAHRKIVKTAEFTDFAPRKWMCGITSHLPTDWFRIPRPHIAARSVTRLMTPTLNASKAIVSPHVTGAAVLSVTSLVTMCVYRRRRNLSLRPRATTTTMPPWLTSRMSKRTRPHDLIPPPLPRPHIPCRPLCRKRQNQRFTLCVLVEHVFQP